MLVFGFFSFLDEVWGCKVHPWGCVSLEIVYISAICIDCLWREFSLISSFNKVISRLSSLISDHKSRWDHSGVGLFNVLLCQMIDPKKRSTVSWKHKKKPQFIFPSLSFYIEIIANLTNPLNELLGSLDHLQTPGGFHVVRLLDLQVDVEAWLTFEFGWRRQTGLFFFHRNISGEKGWLLIPFQRVLKIFGFESCLPPPCCSDAFSIHKKPNQNLAFWSGHYPIKQWQLFLAVHRQGYRVGLQPFIQEMVGYPYMCSWVWCEDCGDTSLLWVSELRNASVHLGSPNHRLASRASGAERGLFGGGDWKNVALGQWEICTFSGLEKILPKDSWWLSRILQITKIACANGTARAKATKPAKKNTTTAAATATAATTATSTATQLDESLHTHLIHVIPVKYGDADWQRRMWV